jgi:hypothetical protein
MGGVEWADFTGAIQPRCIGHLHQPYAILLVVTAKLGKKLFKPCKNFNILWPRNG